jgi:4-amino-4-deoxy-L-arabinose transferase-like glycosyltransferase
MGNQIQGLPGIADQESYDMLARQVLAGKGFTVITDWWPLTRAGESTAHWSYLYTLYLAGVYAIFGPNPVVARLIQAVVVGALWPVLTFVLGRRIASERVGLIASAWSAVYGYFSYYGAALMTEAFYITAILASLWLTVRLAQARPASIRGYLLLGLCLGITVLLRQVFLLFVPIQLLWLGVALWRGRAPFRRTAVRLAAPLLVMAVLIAPWTVRNYLAFHQFVLLNTNAGFAFFWGNHPIYGTTFQATLKGDVRYADLVPAALKPLNEAALDSALLREGIGFVTADPVRYALLSFSRLHTFFVFWPEPDSGTLSNVVRVMAFGVALPFMLAGLAMAIRQWRRWSLLYAFAAVYSAAHLLSWALIRYRLPVDAVLILFAALPIDVVWRRLSPAHSKRDQGPAVKTYPQIRQISADFDIVRTNKESE